MICKTKYLIKFYSINRPFLYQTHLNNAIIDLICIMSCMTHPLTLLYLSVKSELNPTKDKGIMAKTQKVVITHFQTYSLKMKILQLIGISRNSLCPGRTGETRAGGLPRGPLIWLSTVGKKVILFVCSFGQNAFLHFFRMGLHFGIIM